LELLHGVISELESKSRAADLLREEGVFVAGYYVQSAHPAA